MCSAVPVSCNTAIEDSDAFVEVLRTRIGSPYLLAGMEQLADRYERVAGFEANGGSLLGSAIEKEGRLLEPLPTRDALLPALTLMVSAVPANKLSSSLADLLARYTACDRLKAFPRERWNWFGVCRGRFSTKNSSPPDKGLLRSKTKGLKCFFR